MVNRPSGHPVPFRPSHLETIRAEVPAYDGLQDAVTEATASLLAEWVLDLGVGTGETSRRVLDLRPEAALVGIDESAETLAAASANVVAADLRVSRLEDPLPGATSTSSCQRSPCTTSTVQVRTCAPTGTVGADCADPGFSRLAVADQVGELSPRSRCAENRNSVLIRYAKISIRLATAKRMQALGALPVVCWRERNTAPHGSARSSAA